MLAYSGMVGTELASLIDRFNKGVNEMSKMSDIVERAFKEKLEHTGTPRIVLFVEATNGECWQCTYSLCDTGIYSARDDLQDVAVEMSRL